MHTAKRLNNIGEYYFSRKLREIAAMKAAGKAIINLGIGSPDLPPHPTVIETLVQSSASPDAHSYQPYKGIPALRAAIAAWYLEHYQVKLDAEKEILPLIGSKEGIMHICMTYLQENDQALVPDPGYPTYSAAVQLAGAVPMPYTLTEENDWFPDLKALEKEELKAVKIMFINYPHMPTGQLPTRDLFTQLVAFARKHQILLIHDNPYSFILNDTPMSLLATDGAMDVAIELNSLSKSHNMAGWRIGMVIGNEKRINEILTFKSNMDSGMFMPMQLAATTALKLDRQWFNELNEVYRERKEKALALLEALDCRTNGVQAGMFLWASIPDKYADCYALTDELLQDAGVFLTPGGIFGDAGKRYIRLSLCSTVEKISSAIESVNKLKESKKIVQ